MILAKRHTYFGEKFMTKKVESSIGDVFNKLVVISNVDRKKGRRIVECICECGEKGFYDLAHLKDNHTQSCGCLVKETARKNFTTHGMSKTRFNKVFIAIKRRCNNKRNLDYSRYGGRGIKCEWKSFEEFYRDMYESYELHIKEFGVKNTTIERKNNNGNYSKKNCKWATYKEQNNNKRSNVFLDFRGEKKSIKDWSIKLGVSKKTLFSRIYRNWSVEEIFTIPFRGKTI